MSGGLLSKTGLLVIDNTLFRGSVLNLNNNSELKNSEPKTESKINRTSRLGSEIHLFNTYVLEDCSVETFILPIRDGLTLIRYK
jgi:predicted O-methyltransferase YrrM